MIVSIALSVVVAFTRNVSPGVKSLKESKKEIVALRVPGVLFSYNNYRLVHIPSKADDWSIYQARLIQADAFLGAFTWHWSHTQSAHSFLWPLLRVGCGGS